MLHEKALTVAVASENPSVAAAPPNFTGLWRNQMRSTMDLTIDGRHVSGVYTSASSDDGPPIASVDLCGFVAGDLISFIAYWPGGSMTSWVGQMIDDQTAPRVRTLWHLITEIADPSEASFLWKSTLAGADEFTR